MRRKSTRRLPKKRNQLKLEQRVEVIREFERTPNCKKLAKKFNSSLAQIKRIIDNKEAVLSKYQNRKPEKKQLKKQIQRERISPRKRNALSIQEQVIRDYEKTPVYLSLSRKYNCSESQIRSIIDSKEAMLSYSRNAEVIRRNNLECRRLQKIEFLDKVILEYIGRALFRNMAITEDMVTIKAMEIKKTIKLVNHYPCNMWLKHFKSTYKISSFDKDELRKLIKIDGPKGVSFNTSELMEYVSNQTKLEQQMEVVNANDCQNTLDEIENINLIDDVMSSNQKDSVTLFFESDGRSDSGFEGASCSKLPEEEMFFESDGRSDSGFEGASCSKLPEEDCDQKVFNDLQIIENFVMMTENYRAVGLIARLEEVLKNTPNNEEFDDVKGSDGNDYVTVILKSDEEIDNENKFEGASSSEVEICYEEALRHLKVLEDFAMLEENYRAIGLIGQLEQALKNPPNNNFES